MSNDILLPTGLLLAAADFFSVLATGVDPFSIIELFPKEQYAHGMFEGVRLLTVTVTSTFPSSQLREVPFASNCSTTAVLENK